MLKPNFLLLDEPTNDLDILTLNVLEEYLREFEGCVIIVSHDRFFMDKIIDHLFIFDGKGEISDFPGNYTLYRNSLEATASVNSPSAKEPRIKSERPDRKEEKTKLTYKEKRELEELENEISQLEIQKREFEEMLNSGTLPTEELIRKSLEIAKIARTLEEKEFRWLELSERNS